MSVFTKQLVIPQGMVVEEGSKTAFYAKFTAEPYEKGYGHTIGNSLRRILLSSIEGAAVIAVSIKGVRHEYDTVNGVQEDVINILLNLKKMRVRLHGDESQTLYLSVKGKKEVTAADIKENAFVEIINKDLVIAHVESGFELEAQIEIARGTGYYTSDEIKAMPGCNLPAEFIPTDAVFSPIVKVHYNVENARVGQKTDYDKLILEVWTDGTVDPEAVVNRSAELLRQSVTPFLPAVQNDAGNTTSGGSVETPEDAELRKKLDQGVEMIELSARAGNCLKVAGIRTVRELVSKTQEDLLNVKNFGQKTLEEINEKVVEMGLTLGMKL
jgi:DNA-directed RNA polymerase subunit alpha